MTITPLFDKILVKRADPTGKSHGGVLLLSGDQEKKAYGTVIAVGPGKRDKHGVHIPINLSPGDEVIFDKLAGQEVKVDGVPHLIMFEDDIFAAIEHHKG